MNYQNIKKIAVDNGFSLKQQPDGSMDLNPYVYDFARAIQNQIPPFLIEMSKQLNEQDNRITADPIFEVRRKEYLVTEQGFNESHWELHKEDGEGCPVYSSKPFYDNVAAFEDFESENKKWCSDWILENIDSECVGEDSQFTDFFNVESHKDNLGDWPEGYYVIHLQEVEKTVKTCLTESDAKAFIARKQHDYPALYTYVNSMVFCPQMIELRNWIMSLTKEQD